MSSVLRGLSYVLFELDKKAQSRNLCSLRIYSDGSGNLVFNEIKGDEYQRVCGFQPVQRKSYHKTVWQEHKGHRQTKTFNRKAADSAERLYKKASGKVLGTF